MKRPFHTLDVFTQTALAGAPLAVVSAADGLDTARMQAIAREFNLSETAFVLPPRDPIHTARLRIFTPTAEASFAGHPTVGAAVLIAGLRAPEFAGGRDLAVVLEEATGPVRCHVRLNRAGASFCYFELPVAPWRVCDADAGALAEALGLAADDIGFDAHRPQVWSAGAPICFVPVRSLAAIGRAAPHPALLGAAAAGGRGVFLYTRETIAPDHAAHARVFGVDIGAREEPATAAAAAAFAGVAVAFEAPPDGAHDLILEQGYEMGRPSQIVVGLQVENGALARATIGGHAVRVSDGTLNL